ncbi:MAG: helix-turn-helix domain-containing protein [Clostridia bacterium]|nr:helix-turn-helix domain-containing protein [Clostridia bacterium]
MSKLSEQLLELMNEDGLTQKTLAEKLNTSRPKLSLYLNDKSLPTFQVFVQLIEFFNCSADFLIGNKDYPERSRKYAPVQPFGIRLKSLLNERGISQYSFKMKTNISWSVLHGWFTGKSLPSIDNLKKVAENLGCSVDYILGRES